MNRSHERVSRRFNYFFITIFSFMDKGSITIGQCIMYIFRRYYLRHQSYTMILHHFLVNMLIYLFLSSNGYLLFIGIDDFRAIDNCADFYFRMLHHRLIYMYHQLSFHLILMIRLFSRDITTTVISSGHHYAMIFILILDLFFSSSTYG